MTIVQPNGAATEDPATQAEGDLTPQPPLRRGEGEQAASCMELPLSAPERGLGGEVGFAQGLRDGPAPWYPRSS